MTMRDPKCIRKVRRRRMRDTEHDHDVRREAERNAVTTTNRRNSRWLQARRLVTATRRPRAADVRPGPDVASLGVVSRLSGLHFQCPVGWHCQAAIVGAVMFHVFSMRAVVEMVMCSMRRPCLGLFAERKSRLLTRQASCTDMVCRSACDE